MCYRGKLFTGENEPLFHVACSILVRLEQAGHAAFVVGGAVRDALLAQKVNDLDIATSATPEQVAALFPHSAPTGLKHGTITVITEGHAFEVTTFRREGPYKDSRRPDYVQFVPDLQTDLSRRDFTINAMACNRWEEIIDPFDGMSDLRSKMIRSVGKAEARFREDALRILRAVRFAAKLQFSIEPMTRHAMRVEKAALRNLAMERVTNELNKLFAAEQPGEALRLLWSEQLLNDMMPFSAQQNFLPADTYFAQLDDEPDTDLRWILFLRMTSVTARQSRLTMRRFKLPRKMIQELSFIWQEAERWSGVFFSVKEAKKLVFSFGLRRLIKTIKLAFYFGNISYEDMQRLRRQFCHADWEIPLEDLSQLALSGNVLIQRSGHLPGPWVGEVRQVLLRKVVAGEVQNNESDLEREWRQYGPHAP